MTYLHHRTMVSLNQNTTHLKDKTGKIPNKFYDLYIKIIFFLFFS
jgi:hypothetical protein